MSVYVCVYIYIYILLIIRIINQEQQPKLGGRFGSPPESELIDSGV